MIIQCQGCQKRYNIDEKKIPAGAKQAKCKTCGGTILLSPAPQEPARKEQVTVKQKNGPFGLWMGMTKNDFESPLEEIAPCKFRASVVPKPHSAFDRYVCQIAPQSGLSWIKAVGKTIETSSYGIELKLAFDAMEQKLSKIYGKNNRSDILLTGSIWNEPRDWMQGLLSNERLLFSQWNKETKASMTDSLLSIALLSGAYNTSQGYIAIEYIFENTAKAEVEIAALEDDAL